MTQAPAVIFKIPAKIPPPARGRAARPAAARLKTARPATGRVVANGTGAAGRSPGTASVPGRNGRPTWPGQPAAARGLLYLRGRTGRDRGEGTRRRHAIPGGCLSRRLGALRLLLLLVFSSSMWPSLLCLTGRARAP